MDGLAIDGLVDFEQRKAVDAVDGNDGLGGLLEKAAYGKTSKFGLGEFRVFWGGQRSRLDVSCMRTVPEAVIAFLDSEDFEHTLRLAVSLGGDSDTLAAITGSIAEAYYQQIPSVIIEKALVKLPDEMKEVFI